MRKGLAIVSYRAVENEIHLHEIQFFYHNFTNWTFQLPYVTPYKTFDECILHVLDIAKHVEVEIDISKDGDFPDIYFTDGYHMKHFHFHHN